MKNLSQIINYNLLNNFKAYEVSKSSTLDYDDKIKKLKLDWNESTIKPSEPIINDLINYIKKGHINFYPDVNAFLLRKTIGDYLKIDIENIRVYNGSDSALNYICMTFLNADEKVLVRNPTYTQINTYVSIMGAQLSTFLGRDIFSKEINSYISLINEISPKLIYIANPNNPTGLLYDPDDVEKIITSCNNSIFIIDEAYIEFGGKSCLNLVNKYENIIILRTFSKAFGLAGLRVGYTLSHQNVSKLLDLTRNGKDVNILGQLACITSLKNIDSVDCHINEILDTKEWFYSELKSNGFEVFNCIGNWILICSKFHKYFISKLEDRNILVRDRSNLDGMKNFFRISIGNKTQMEIVLKELLDINEEINDK